MKDSKKKTLRVVDSNVRPAFTEEDLNDHRHRDDTEGRIGKGPLTRKYCDNIDMEFYAFRSDSKDEPTSVLSSRFPDSVLFDIAIMVESGKTPFRTKSEFIRTAVFILLNYYGQKFASLGKRFSVREGIRECKYHEDIERLVKEYRDSFKEAVKVVFKKSDKEIDRFVRKHAAVIQSIDPNIREEVIREFSNLLSEGGINPIPYFGDGEEEGR